MAHSTISEAEFLDLALDVFRTYGFEGVSLSRLSEATGLEKPSLYYRYPGGKEQIAMAVVKRALDWFEHQVFAPLKGAGSPHQRVTLVAGNLREFYLDGKKSCIMDVLSIPGASGELKAALKGAMQAWIHAFSVVARETGVSSAMAKARGELAALGIEGSLILARVLGDRGAFQRTIQSLPDFLTRP